MKIPKNRKPPFSVKSDKLFTNLNEIDKTNLKVVFSVYKKESIKEYDLKILSSGKEFSSYKIKSKEDDKGCLSFYID